MQPVFNLNVFSNVACSDPRRNLASRAVRSAIRALRPNEGHEVRVRLFCDPNPFPECWDAWTAAIREQLSDIEMEIHRTRGLADGYRRSIELSEGAVALQLEHDFILLRRRILHSAGELSRAMLRHGVDHLRFSKRWNRPVGYDAFMVEREFGDMPCCRVPGRSNNPHLIDVAFARERVAPLIDAESRGASGLEGRLELHLGGGHVYGGLGWAATSAHLDGRNARLRDRLLRPFRLAAAD